MYFTSSWDDGTETDIRLARLLEQYECPGTFYVCPAERGRKNLTTAQIRVLGEYHEIGAHSMTHPHLSSLHHTRATEEIVSSKLWVEDVTQNSCTMFCYPYGDTNRRICETVRSAGFRGARTTQILRFTGKDPFLLPTSVQIRPFPRRQDATKFWHTYDPFGPLRSMAPGLIAKGIHTGAWHSWRTMTCALFDHAYRKKQPWFHVWGHSSEVEKYDLWDDLEHFLMYIATKKDVQPVKNSTLIS